MPHLEQTADLGIFYQVDNHSDPWTNPKTIIFIHGFTENVAAWHNSTTRFQSSIQILF
jgi:pimeloyl-ACP methyl ester carboxylesterase